MGITSAIVLFSVIWFMVLFVLLPLGMRSQGDEGDVVPGTQPGAPAEFKAGRMAKRVTVIAVVLWCIIAAVIIYGGLTVRDLDWFGRMGPAPLSDSESGG